MTTTDIIETVLGPVWWYREHDPAAVAAAVDLLMERRGWELSQAIYEVLSLLHGFMTLATLQGSREQQLQKEAAVLRLNRQLGDLYRSITKTT